MHERFAKRVYSGFTLVEMATSLLATSALILVMGMFLADNQKAFNATYDHAYSPVAEDDIAARLTFQRTVRRASSARGAASVASDGRWLEVQYRSGVEVLSPDRSARFHLSGRDLLLETSVLETMQSIEVETVCRNVDSVTFTLTGNSVQMFLELNDGTSRRVLSASAVRRSP